jgi:hypothetical protein
MRVYDGIYRWEGFGGALKLASGSCRLRIFDLSRGGARGVAHLRSTVVIVSDDPESPMSARSCAGHIATCVARDFRIDPQRMLYVEHSPPIAYGPQGEHLVPEKFDAVDFNWTEGGAIQPRWRELQAPLRELMRSLLSGDG